MQALPSAFFHQVSSAARILVPRAWMAKSTIVVVPPIAAARVPVSKVVGRVGAAEGHVEMRMRVDAAGEHQQAGGIDDFVGSARRNARADFLDDRAIDQEIGFYA